MRLEVIACSELNHSPSPADCFSEHLERGGPLRLQDRRGDGADDQPAQGDEGDDAGESTATGSATCLLCLLLAIFS
jgi:hypothetical protein